MTTSDTRSSGLLDPFALGGRQDDDDAILTLFRKWRDCTERFEACKSDDGADYEPLYEVLIETQRQIYDAEAHGLIGLAIKALMLGYASRLRRGEVVSAAPRGGA
jgi:hypothetical protein